MRNSVAPGNAVARRATGRRRLSRSLARRLESGEHILLWGPRGIGKTALLNEIMKEVEPRRCALSATTDCLDDVTRVLESAYADVPTKGLARRMARARLWRAADADPAVLLLDHVTRVPTAMKGWFRRLRGGVAGILLAVDVDSPRERERLRALRVGCAMVRAPAVPSRSLARQLDALLAPVAGPPVPAPIRRALTRAARGRPGWVVQCSALAADRRYWDDGGLRVNLLIWDTEVRLRGVRGSLPV